jgi:hypothetical protein
MGKEVSRDESRDGYEALRKLGSGTRINDLRTVIQEVKAQIKYYTTNNKKKYIMMTEYEINTDFTW